MAVNDEIFKNLEVYGGGTINERVYNFLGSLGYTGTINDRLGQFEEGGRKGWQGLVRAWGQYTPAQVFSQGQQGVWYEPKPIVAGQQVLYQDSAGTTPVTADGDPVGLMLDLSRGLVKGPELITNGTFDDNSGWATDSGWSISGGVATVLAGSNVAIRHVDSLPLPAAGRAVLIELDATITSGSLAFNFGGTGTADYTLVNGENSIIRIMDGSETGDVDVRTITAGTEAAVDNISVRELPGNHATQSTSAARPIYRTDGVLHWLEGDGVDDVLISALTLSSTGVLVASAKALANQSTGLWFSQQGGAPRGYLGAEDGAALYGAGDVRQNSGRDALSSHVALIDNQVSTGIRLYYNDELIGSFAQSDFGTTVTLRVAGDAGSFSVPNLFYGGLYSTASPSDDDIAKVIDHIASLAGVAI